MLDGVRMRRFRVVTWNLDHHPLDLKTRRGQATDLLKSLDADAICLQELPGEEGREDAQIIAARLGMKVAAEGSTGTYVLTRCPILRRVDFPFSFTDTGSATGALIEKEGQRFLVVSAHLAWGSGREAARLSQSIEMDRIIGEHASLEPFRTGGNQVVAVIGGDLNAEPTAASIRYLTGLGVENGFSTLWTDAWCRGEGLGITSSAKNPLAARTALSSSGIELVGDIPERRIDYILVRGYAYGRTGAPVYTKLFGTPDTDDIVVSDHYGLVSDLRIL